MLPDHAPLESWGDAEPRPGIRGIVQPTLRPLYDTRSLVDTLLDAARAMGPDVAAKLPADSFRTLVEQAWAGTDFHDVLATGGVFAPAGRPRRGAASRRAADFEVAEPALEGEGEFTLLASPSPLLYDGRGANLPWLQETPDPVTKITWQSFAELSPRAAEKLGGLEFGDVLEVETKAGKSTLPVVVRGGLRDDVIAIAIGQGHTVGMFSSMEDLERPGGKRGINVIELLPALTDESRRTRMAADAGAGREDRQAREAADLPAVAEPARSPPRSRGDAPGAGRGRRAGGRSRRGRRRARSRRLRLPAIPRTAKPPPRRVARRARRRAHQGTTTRARTQRRARSTAGA